jgi:hypothetical protein
MTTAVIDPQVTEQATRRLGCTCESPEPRAEGSALCAQCGLVFLTSEEYAEHLARSRAAVEEMLARLPKAVEASQPEESGSRRWWRRDPRQS